MRQQRTGDKIKKLAIVTRCMNSGGAERVISQLLQHFVEEIDSCYLITINKDKIDYAIPSSVHLIEIGKTSENYYVDKFYRFKTLRSIIKKIEPDVVLSLPEDIGIYVILSLIGTQNPVVVAERSNPWVMPYKKITRLLRRVMYPFAAGIIFQTEQAAAFFPKYIRKKGIVLSNPLDLSRIPEPYTGERDKVIVSAGRLEKEKNFKLLINAFSVFYKSYPDYKLFIYGEGRLRSDLEQHARTILPEGVVEFPGHVDDLLQRINSCAVFALSSDYEGVPNVLIEAMAMGMPVISTDYAPGGGTNLIKNKINGCLISVGDEKGLAEGLSMYIESRSFAIEMSENAIKIRSNLDSRIVAGEWIQYLCSVGRKQV